MSYAGVILAAGSGSRYKGPTHKLAAELRGRPLAQWSIDALSVTAVDERVIVLGATSLDADVPDDFTVLQNHDWADGLATSLMTAVHWARLQGHEGVIVGLADQPGVTSVSWGLVLSSRERPIAVATYEGKRRNPVRLDRLVWDMLPTTGDEGARALIASRPELVTEVVCPDNPLDIDTLEDLTTWK